MLSLQCDFMEGFESGSRTHGQGLLRLIPIPHPISMIPCLAPRTHLSKSLIPHPESHIYDPLTLIHHPASQFSQLVSTPINRVGGHVNYSGRNHS